MKLQIRKKIRDLSKPARASVVFTICSFLQKGISFCVVPIYTRIMDQGQYGSYTTFLSWMSIISVIATLNLSYHVYINGIIKYNNNRDDYTSSMVGLSGLITLGVFLVYFFGRNLFNNIFELSTTFVILMFVELLLQPSYEFWAASKRFDYNYKQLAILTVALSLAVPIVSIPVILHISEESKALGAIACKVIITSLFYMIPLVIILSKKKPIYNKEYWKFALGFNIPLIPHFLSVILLQQCDRLMISNICGKEQVAMYSVAFSVSTIMTLVNTSVLNSFTPWTYQSMERKDYARIKKAANSICLLIAVINMLVIFVAPDVIQVIAPPSYLDGIYVMVPLIASVYFMFSVNLYVNIEYYFAKVKYVTIGTMGAVVTNIILNAIFIPKYGFIAAGYTTLASYIMYCIGHFLIVKRMLKSKKIRVDKIYDSRIVFGIGLGLITISVLCSALYKNAIIRYALFLVLCIIVIVNRNRIKKMISVIKK